MVAVIGSFDIVLPEADRTSLANLRKTYKRDFGIDLCGHRLRSASQQARDQRDDEQNNEDEEEDLRDFGRACGDAAEDRARDRLEHA